MPDIALTALAEGRLAVRDGCVRIGGTRGHLVIWPMGSRLVQDGGHRMVATPDGRRFRIGRRVSLGGGSSDRVPEGLVAPLPPACRGPFFFAN